jgi:hypothetical protein
MALSPHIDAVACGHAGYDLDVLREGAAVFTALYHDHIAFGGVDCLPASPRAAAIRATSARWL